MSSKIFFITDLFEPCYGTKLVIHNYVIIYIVSILNPLFDLHAHFTDPMHTMNMGYNM